MTAMPQDGKRHYSVSTILIVILMTMGSVAYAFSAGVIATTFGQPSFINYMGIATLSNANDILGAAGSLYYAGGFLGAFFGHWASDAYGRKPTIFIGLAVVLVSQALCAGSVHIAMFIVFRFTSGFGGIVLSMVVPMWITECVPPEVRGAFSQLHGSAVDLGYFLASYIGVAFYRHVREGNNAWRGPQALGCLFCIPLLAGLYWIPESPRYLLLKGKEAGATAVIRRFHTAKNDTEHRFADVELYQMRKQIELDRTLPSSWLDMVRKPTYRKRFIMAIFVTFTIQATGSQVLAIYATLIYTNLGFGPEKVLLLQAGLFAMMWPLATFCCFYTERFQRPRLISFGLAGMTAVLCCYAALTAEYLDSANNSGKLAAVAMTYLFFAFYVASVEGPFYYYVAELFPTHLRAKGMTLQASTFCWTSILWAQAAPTAIANIGWRFFLIFIILSAVGAVVIWLYYPNTQGKTLEEIATFFGDQELVVVHTSEMVLDSPLAENKLEKITTTEQVQVETA